MDKINELLLTEIKSESDQVYTLTKILNILNSETVSNYHIRVSYHTIRADFNLRGKKIELSSCAAQLNIRLPTVLEELVVSNVKFVDENGNAMQKVYMKDWIPWKLEKLNFSGSLLTDCVLDLDRIPYIKKLFLERCVLNVSAVDSRLCPEELELNEVKFNWGRREMDKININVYFNFSKTNRLILKFSTKINAEVDLSDSVSVDYAHLKNVEVCDWIEAKWSVRTLILENVDFLKKTQLKVEEMEIISSVVDISTLPNTLQKLTLMLSRKATPNAHENIDLPSLTYLVLSEVDSSFLAQFTSINLTHVHFIEMEDLNVDFLPDSAKQIKITYSKQKKTMLTAVIGFFAPKSNGEKRRVAITNGQREVSTLIVEDYYLQEVRKMLTNLQAKHLVVAIDSIEEGDLPTVLKLTEEISSIAIGMFTWSNNYLTRFGNYLFGRKAKLVNDFETSILAQHVDGKSNYYHFEAESGMALTKEEFDILMRLVK